MIHDSDSLDDCLFDAVAGYDAAAAAADYYGVTAHCSCNSSCYCMHLIRAKPLAVETIALDSVGSSRSLMDNMVQ